MSKLIIISLPISVITLFSGVCRVFNFSLFSSRGKRNEKCPPPPKVFTWVWCELCSFGWDWVELPTLQYWRSHGWERAHPTSARAESWDLHKFGVFWRSRVGAADSAEPEGTPYISYKHIMIMCLSTADCICISGFWGLCPHTPTRAWPLNPAGRLLSPRSLCPPYLQTLKAMLMLCSSMISSLPAICKVTTSKFPTQLHNIFVVFCRKIFLVRLFCAFLHAAARREVLPLSPPS